MQRLDLLRRQKPAGEGGRLDDLNIRNDIEIPDVRE